MSEQNHMQAPTGWRIAAVEHLGDDLDAIELVNQDGATAYWLHRRDISHEGRTGTPWHEHDAPLDPAIRRELRRRTCGHLTKAGTPCRNTKGRCQHHEPAQDSLF